MGSFAEFWTPAQLTAEGTSLLAGRLEEAVEILGTAIAAVGTLIIVYGVLRGLWGFAKIETSTLTRGDVRGREALRRNLGYYLLLGLEFLVAADIVESMGDPTLEHLATLGAIVVIRTVISYTLNWELSREEAREPTREAAEPQRS